MVSIPQVSLSKPCMHLSCLPYVSHAPPISFFLIWSPEYRLIILSDNYRLHFLSACLLHYVTRSADRPHEQWCSSRKWQKTAVKQNNDTPKLRLTIYQSPQPNILQQHRCENIKSRKATGLTQCAYFISQISFTISRPHTAEWAVLIR
jgi:hypothetical protein